MEQHPIPSQISSYQFRLVGDMTLKQFFQVGGGALLAIILYSSNLPTYVKWPLIIISFLFGVALAFFPLEDRPLSKWLVLFAKSIYAPTLYLWMSNYQKPSYFQPESAVQDTGTLVPEVPVSTETPTELEQNEQQFLTKVDQFSDNTNPTPVAPSQPQYSPLTIDSVTPVQVEQNLTPIEIPQEEEKKEPVQIPTQEVVAVEKSEKPADFTEVKQEEPVSDVGSDINPMVGQKTQNTTDAQFSPDAAPPIPPSRPNIIVGQVMDNQGKIVENAILEIKDEEGISRRALRTNKLGHFISVTPLMDGKYDILTEKDGLNFDPIHLEATGAIIPPIAIKANA